MADSELRVGITGDSRQFAGETQKVLAAIDRMRSSLAAASRSMVNNFAALFGGRAIVQQIRQTIEYGGRLTDLRDRLQVSTDALQRWEYAARQGGAGLDAVVMSVQKLGIAQTAALQGNQEYLRSFERLNISARELRQMDLETLFDRVSREIGKGAGGTTAMYDALRVLGEGAGPLLTAMRDGFAETADAAAELGTIIGEDAADEFDALGDKIDMVSMKLRSMTADALMGAIKMWERYVNLVSAWQRGWGSALRTVRESAGSRSSPGDVLRAAISRGVETFGETRQALDAAGAQEDAAAASRREARRARRQSGLPTLGGLGGAGSGAGRSSADELTRIGLFVGGRNDPLLAEAKRQTAATKRVEESIKSLDDTVRDTL